MLFRKKNHKQFMITIPEPCREDWEKMRIVDSTRRHCASCEKTLVDFSMMSDDEIASYLRYRFDQKLCGRFSSAQLNRSIPQIPESRIQSRWRMRLLFPLTLIGKLVSAQQDSVPQHDTTQFTLHNDSMPVVDSSAIAGDSLAINDSSAVAVDTLGQRDSTIQPIPVVPLQGGPYIWNPPTLVYPIMLYPGATTGFTTIVMGDIICPTPPPASTVIGGIGTPESTPFSDPDKRIISGRSRIPTGLPEEKPKENSGPPPLPATPWYSALIPAPFRRKKNKNEK